MSLSASYGPWASFLKASLRLVHSRDALSPSRGQVRGRKEAGNALRDTILGGSCFVSLVEIQGFGSGSSRILGLRVGKNQFLFLVPFFYLVPCVFWAWGLKNFLLHLSDLHRKCQGIKLELCPIEIGDIALSSGCGSTKHSALCYDVTGWKRSFPSHPTCSLMLWSNWRL